MERAMDDRIDAVWIGLDETGQPDGPASQL